MWTLPSRIFLFPWFKDILPNSKWILIPNQIKKEQISRITHEKRSLEVAIGRLVQSLQAKWQPWFSDAGK